MYTTSPNSTGWLGHIHRGGAGGARVQRQRLVSGHTSAAIFRNGGNLQLKLGGLSPNRSYRFRVFFPSGLEICISVGCFGGSFNFSPKPSHISRSLNMMSL